MGAHILIVDDDADVRRMVALTLRGRGYEVTECGEGDEALRLARESPFDLALLDVLMPKMNGFELCRRLEQAAGDRRLPTIMLTCLDHAEQKLLGFEAGADDYVCKPFPSEELVARIEAVLRRSRSSDGGAGQTQGKLSDLSLADLMQIMAAGGKTGTIELARDGARGTVGIVNGQPVGSHLGDAIGEQAIFAMLSWHSGAFAFRPGEPSSAQNLPPSASAQALILEAARRVDEHNRETKEERARAASEAARQPMDVTGQAGAKPPPMVGAEALDDVLKRLAAAYGVRGAGPTPGGERSVRLVIAGPTAAGREGLFAAFQQLLAPYRAGVPRAASPAGSLPWDRVSICDGLTLYIYGVGTEPGQSYLWSIALENVAGCVVLVDARDPGRIEQSLAFCQAAARHEGAVFSVVIAAAANGAPDPAAVRGALALPAETTVVAGSPTSPQTAQEALEAWIDALCGRRSTAQAV